ncbi:MAG: DUF3368 domain-containing protein [Nitrospirae bacterium]|nr:DUF3368 domain-containing protein [Nitrospirota bacterium]
MKKIIVSDATSVIAFSRINKLKLLQEITGEIIIPGEVSKELFAYNKADVKKLKSCKWIKVKEVKAQNDVGLLMPALDKGEAEVIILSKELKSSLVIIDELSARKVAMMMGLPLIGTVGLLIAAKEKGLIERVKPLWDEIIGVNLYNSVIPTCSESFLKRSADKPQ